MLNRTVRALNTTVWKMSKYGGLSGPYFPAFGLNTERYEVSLRIQSECGKIRTRKNSVFGHSSRSVPSSVVNMLTPVSFLEVFAISLKLTMIIYTLVHFALHEKWSFPLRISPVDVTKSAGNCGFGYIYWRNP